MKYNKLLKIGIIGLSLVTLNATNIKQVQDVSKYPISSDLISVSRGGTLPDKKAITDGLGSVLIGSLNLSEKSYSNKSFNKELLKSKKNIIDNDKSLENLIIDGIVILDSTTKDKINNRNILVDITNSSNIPNGTSCNDNNPQTINDIYTNNVCTGNNVEGNSCNDNDSQTINDVYNNGVCVGTNVENQTCDDGDNSTVNTTYHNGICQGGNLVGDTCDDSNSQTINDLWLSNGNCIGTNVEGNSCDDGDNTTINTTYHNGICQGGNIVGDTCDDSNAQTINDIWLSNGTCVGTNVEGNNCDDGDNTTVNTTYHNSICQGGNIVGDTCDDSNAQTINDIWLSDGTCVGTNVENQTCDDNNSQTLDDIYINGICVGTPIITIIGDDTNGRTWSDGTVAQSCNQYKNTLPDNYHKYQGNIGDGVYQITLNSNSFKVYCDMTTDNGGWMAVKYTNNLDTIVESSTHISTNYYLNINIIEDMLSISSEILFVEPSSNVKAKTIPSTYNTIVTNINSGNLWFNNMLNQEMSNYLVSVESGLLPDAIRAGCANNPGNLSIFDSCNNTEGAHSALNNHHRMRDGIYYGNKPNSVFIR